jgi:hypothetical protein
MGRLFLIAGIAVLASSVSALAKPDQAKNGKAERSVGKDAVGYGAGGCPPGLRRQNPECMPPGQRKKLFEVGQRVPSGYKGLMRYNSLPSELRNQYGGTLDPRARYIYDQQYLYRVDPTTMIVRQVLRGVIGN